MTADVRKTYPLFRGLARYFPKALMEVAHCSWVGNEQHNPGQELHWDRSKSTDEHDALLRHLWEAGTVDTDGVRHSTKAAWRALAALEKELEAAHDVGRQAEAASAVQPARAAEASPVNWTYRGRAHVVKDADFWTRADPPGIPEAGRASYATAQPDPTGEP
jgi:hypothetical protein